MTSAFNRKLYEDTGRGQKKNCEVCGKPMTEYEIGMRIVLKKRGFKHWECINNLKQTV